MRFRTRAIHVGNEPDQETGAIVPPIHLATTFVLPEAGAHTAYDYSRSGNPTRDRFEETLASLEGGIDALAFSSGMAATHCAIMLLEPGEHVVTGTDLYGGTYRLLNKVSSRAGIANTMVRTDDLSAFENAFTPRTRLAWIESPGNPLLSVTDIAACAEIAHRKGALLAVDNTFATPVLTRPLELGADIVMHAATKYLGGHSDALGGALVVKDADLRQRLWFLQNATGGVLAPLESYLCGRGLKTLDLRMREHCRSAQLLAELLAAHPKVRRVYYPGLADHPGHALARRQMQGGFGGIISVELDADFAAAMRFVQATRLFQLAVSLGAVESLIEQAATMSHAGYDPAARRAHGISDSLIRLSVGLEDPEDLRADLEQALDEIGRT